MIFVLSAGLYAQEVPGTSVKLLARPLPDSILLRWAPDNYAGLKVGNKYGYYVVRLTIMKAGKLIHSPRPVFLTREPIKPWPLAKCEPLADSDKYMAVAAQAIYGETFSVSAGKNASILDVVNKAKEQDSRFSFALFCADQSRNAAIASGLWYTDRNVKKDEKYLYRVFLAAPRNIVRSDTAFVFTGTEEYLPLPKPLRFSAEFGNKSVILHWDQRILSSYYNSYQIERSEDSIHFSPLRMQPLVQVNKKEEETEEAMFVDTLSTNGKTYYYQLFGISAFGEKSPASDEVKGQGVDDPGFAPEITSKKEVDGRIALEWEFKGEKAHNIGFRILRSAKLDLGYSMISPLLSPDVHSFVDSLPLPVNYYKVMVLGADGNTKISFPALMQPVDSLPPSPPVGLLAIADTTGRVVLHWKANHEPDLMGYRVYRANAPYEEFSQLTVSAIPDTFLIDTINLKTTTRHIYYQVMAVDRRMNHSPFSAILEVERPDIVPPSPPAITDIHSTSDGVFLKWANSSSNDVAEHVVFRRARGDKNYLVLAHFPVSDTLHSFMDTTAVCGEEYDYTVKARDKSGLFSPPAPERAGERIAMSRVLPLKGLKATADRHGLCVNLTWEKPEAKVLKYVIYRQEGETGTLVTYRTVSGNNLFFSDQRVNSDTYYNYMVEAVMEGGERRISEVKGINY
ncbi:MAG: hypothetical protein Q8904_14995 [Bacteroidota bacterium]|nr:hypothetical protein [Bacteroidota bacterium]